MVLPRLKKCCWCLPLESGAVLLAFISIMACVSALSFCAWKLPEHRTQQNEDNLVLLSMTMFATLSLVSNLATLAGIALKRPGCLQLSILSNAVFILCILLVCSVTCLFSPALRPLLRAAGNVALVAVLLLAGAVYSLYYLAAVNSLYKKMKMEYGDSAIPV